MGYEVKMIVGTTPLSILPLDKGAQVILEIARFDLCKIGDGPLSDLLDKTKSEKQYPCYIYASNGNTKITKDRYGDRLYKVPAKDVLKALKNESDDYRRFRTAIVLLKSIIKEFPNENPIVVFYGH